MNDNDVLIESGWKFVISVSGGGQEIIGDLTKYGKMSGTLLEAIVPYEPVSFYRLIGGKTDQIVSPAAARAAAMACYKRAKEYAPSYSNVFGFASTGAVVKVGGEREGRKHNVCMCIQNEEQTCGINITYGLGRERVEEEKLTAACIREALRWGCHRFGDIERKLSRDDELKVESYIAPQPMRDVVQGVTAKHPDEGSRAIFSSSCNPLHAAHLNIITDASKRLGRPIDIELCVQNADKPPLDYRTIMERVTAIAKQTEGNSSVGKIFLTNKPMFIDKAELFPGATFVMGTDTFDRIIDHKYYHGGSRQIYSGFQRFENLDCKLLVYPRKGYESSSSHQSWYDTAKYDLEIMTLISPFDGYEVSDISSTAIRSANRA